MATIIHFVGRDQVMVREDEGEVQSAFAASDGRPVALTHHRTGNPVFVNLGQVTYWRRRGSRDGAQLPGSGIARIPTLR
jgi:hypothetical protein